MTESNRLFWVTYSKLVEGLQKFLINEAKAIAGIDLFTVSTATMRVLYVLVVLLHDRRRVVHFNVTENPSGSWIAQQIVQAFTWDGAPKYVVGDNDRIDQGEFTNRVAGMKIASDRYAGKRKGRGAFENRKSAQFVQKESGTYARAVNFQERQPV